MIQGCSVDQCKFTKVPLVGNDLPFPGLAILCRAIRSRHFETFEADRSAIAV